MLEFKAQISSFVKKIEEAIGLFSNKIIKSKMSLQKWIVTYKKQQQDNTNKSKLINNAKNTQNTNQKMNELKMFQKYLNTGNYTSQFNFKYINLPNSLQVDLKIISGQQIYRQYCQVYGPFLDKNFTNMTEPQLNNLKRNQFLKFTKIGPDFVQKFQRVFVREIFGRLFRSKGCISFVIQILIKGSSPTYYFVEDIIKFKQKIIPIEQIEINYQKFEIQYEKKNYKLNQNSLLQVILSSFMTLPLQPYIPHFECTIIKQEIHFRRNQVDSDQLIKLENNSLKYVGLRNPLLFFKQFFESYKINLQTIINRFFLGGSIYEDYFESLQILFNLANYNFEIINEISISNLCFFFNNEAIIGINQIFHKILIIEKWLKQVVKPIKKWIKINELINQIWPILNEFHFKVNSMAQFKSHFQKLEISNYIQELKKKKCINEYIEFQKKLNIDVLNEYYVNIRSYNVNDIIENIINDMDIESLALIEAVYLIQFYCKNMDKLSDCIPKKNWRGKLWQKIFVIFPKKICNKLYFDNNLAFCPYYFNIDPLKQNNLDWFRIIKHSQQSQINIKKMQEFLFYININIEFQQSKQRIILQLLRKCIQFQKFQFLKIVLEEKGNLQNLCTSFIFEIKKKFQYEQLQHLMSIIKKYYPEKFRRYKWEEIFKVFLKKQIFEKKKNISLQIFGFQNCELPESAVKKLFKLNCEKKYQLETQYIEKDDYIFNLYNDSTKLKTKDFQVYIEYIEKPGIDFFFTKVFQKLDIFFLKPHTTYFSIYNSILTFTQSLDGARRFSQYTRRGNFEVNFIENTNLANAIIATMLTMPTQISFDNILYKKSLNNQEKFNIYLRNLNSCNSFVTTRNNHNPKLQSKNALFLLDFMQTNIENQILQKYAYMNVLEKIRQIFQELHKFNEGVDKLQEFQNHQKYSFKYPKTFLAVPFQKQFLSNFAQRFFIISQQCNRALKQNDKILYIDLLKKIHYSTGIYYKEIINTTKSLMDRWNLLTQYEKKGKNFVSSHLFNFFNKFEKENINSSIEEDNQVSEDTQNLNYVGASQCLLNLQLMKSKFQIFKKTMEERKQKKRSIQIFENCKNQNIQYFMQHLNFNQFEHQDKLLQIIEFNSKLYQIHTKDSRYKVFNTFTLFNYNDNVDLRDMSFQRITQITFEGIKLTEQKLILINNKATCLQYLKLKNISTLKCIAPKFLNSIATVYQLNPLSFNLLKTLIVIGCENLVYIDVKCNELSNVYIKNNSELDSIYIYSKRLQNIYCTLNPVILEANISIYIILGINVFIDEILLKKLISKGEQRANLSYNQIICRLLTKILNNFTIMSRTIKKTLYQLGLISPSVLDQINQSKTFMNRLKSRQTIDQQKILKKKLVQCCFIKNKNLKVLNFQHFREKEVSMNDNLLIEFLSNLAQISTIQYQSIVLKDKLSIDFLILFNQFLKNKVMKQNIKSTLELELQIRQQKFYIDLIQTTSSLINLSRFNLKIKNSKLDINFLNLLLLSCNKNLNSIQFHNTNIIDYKSQQYQENADKCKVLILDKVQLFDICFVLRFKNITVLQICKCQIVASDFSRFLQSLLELKNLRTLKIQQFIRQEKYLIDLIEQLSYLKLEQLTFIQNLMSQKVLQNLNQYLEKSQTLRYLKLTKFIQKQIEYNFSNFLGNTKLRIIQIQFINSWQIFQFFNSLSSNNYLIHLIVHFKQILELFYYEPLLKISTLEIFNITFNIIPVWLLKKIAENKNAKVRKIEIAKSSKDDLILIEDFKYKNDPSKFKLGLSLDGGGMRGLILASQLDYLSKQLKKPLHKIFDCIGGTSIGGILALGSTGSFDRTNPICTTSQLKNIFEQFGTTIFQKNFMTKIKPFYDTKYSNLGIQGVLNEYFKSCRLSDALTNVIVTSVFRENAKVKIFNSKEARFNDSQNFYMKDIARATSAAPLYFPSAEIKNILATEQYSLIDGGMGLNNPSKLVIQEVKKFAQNSRTPQNYFLLSLGTGKIDSQNSIPQKAKYMNIQAIINSFTGAANNFIQNEMIELYNGKYLRVSPNLDIDIKAAQLDNTDIQILAKYKQIGEMTAIQQFSKNRGYGIKKDRTLIQWLQENLQNQQ